MDPQQHRRRGRHFGLFCVEQRVPLGLHSFDLLEQQFEPIEFSTNLGFEMLGQATAIASLKPIQSRTPVATQRLIPGCALREEQSFDPVDVLNPLTEQRHGADDRRQGLREMAGRMKIWRYIDLAKFVNTIATSTVRFTCISEFKEPYEGWLPRSHMKALVYLSRSVSRSDAAVTGRYPEQGYRACLGILRLARSFGVARLEAAAERAIEIGARTYGSVKSILDNKLDRKPGAERPCGDGPDPSPQHPWAPLLPLRRTPTCSSIPPSISFTPLVFMEWPRPSPTSPPRIRRRTCRTPTGSRCSSTGRHHGGGTNGSRLSLRAAGCANRPASKTSTIAPPAVSTAPCSRNSRMANGSTLMTISRSLAPAASAKLACLRHRPESLPRQPFRPLSSLAQAL